MSKAEEFIQENTKDCSNQYDLPEYFENGIKRLKEYQPWLSPDDARKAVEIAREEMAEWIDTHWREYINVDADGVVCFGHWKNDLIKTMKNE
jgi:acetylornithine/succinyldiaminopimelate/putrescine aminotransferase